nr:PD-(D/E)XK motif protein [Streptomyces sp. HNM0574]
MRTAPLPVATASGDLLAAVDHGGHRHLLVPIASHQRVRQGLDGPVLQLRKRPLEDDEVYQTYADLGCLRHDLDDVFTGLCEDILEEIHATGTGTGPAPGGPSPVRALYRVLDRWQSLFRTRGSSLTVDQLAGLFGELTVLNRLLESDPSAHRLWGGPTGHRHDFTTGRDAVEVKASTGNDALRIRVHGLRQLEAPDGGALQLCCFRLERASEPVPSASVVDLVERAMQLCDDESALLGLLAQAGYRSVDAGRYRSVRFLVADERWYDVRPDFPRLTATDLSAADVPITVENVHYTVDLTVEPPRPLPSSRVERHLASLLEGTE